MTKRLTSSDVATMHAGPVIEALEERRFASAAMPLTSVHNFAYVLQGLDQPGAVAAIANTNYDMAIVEPTCSLKGDASFDMTGMVSQLHAAKPGRVVLAYLDIGEAESDRIYWGSDWQSSVGNQAGNPSFLVAGGSNGSAGDNLVAYWDKRWQSMVFNEVNQLMAAGFDGVYLDWVAAYGVPAVQAAAHQQHVNPITSMVKFVSSIRADARAMNPNADIVSLGGADLAGKSPRYLKLVDGVAFNNTWYQGQLGAPWGDPGGGDVPTLTSTTTSLTRQYRKYQKARKPVFTIDFALSAAHAAQVYGEAAKLGYIPLVTQRALSQVSTTPPPNLG